MTFMEMDPKKRCMTEPVYKVCGRDEWEAARAEGRYRGSADDARDGFIHLSTREQLPGTLEKHFAGRDDLLLVEVDPGALGAALKWEPSRGGALFPHLYGALEMSAVRGARAIPRDAGGRHAVPDEVA